MQKAKNAEVYKDLKSRGCLPKHHPNHSPTPKRHLTRDMMINKERLFSILKEKAHEAGTALSGSLLEDFRHFPEHDLKRLLFCVRPNASVDRYAQKYGYEAIVSLLPGQSDLPAISIGEDIVNWKPGILDTWFRSLQLNESMRLSSLQASGSKDWRVGTLREALSFQQLQYRVSNLCESIDGRLFCGFSNSISKVLIFPGEVRSSRQLSAMYSVDLVICGQLPRHLPPGIPAFIETGVGSSLAPGFDACKKS